MSGAPVQLGLLAAIEQAGGQSALARQVGTYRQVVNGWVARGRVPARWVERVADATGVPPWALAPDRYWPEPYVSRKPRL
jgi:DNA-binding transcriptional regulator YdaS (Cro superfamily)